MSLFEPTATNLILVGALTVVAFAWAIRSVPLFSSNAFSALVGGMLLSGFLAWTSAGLPLLPISLVIFAGMLAIPFAIIGTLNTFFGAQQQQ